MPPIKDQPETALPDLESLARIAAFRPHKVVVLDCNCHTFDDVERALMRYIPGMTWEQAHRHANEVHFTGASVVARAPKERAEHMGQGLKACGLRVSVEPD
jgi:ATP-dependent Clp protease adaptor protein ClpS